MVVEYPKQVPTFTGDARAAVAPDRARIEYERTAALARGARIAARRSCWDGRVAIIFLERKRGMCDGAKVKLTRRLFRLFTEFEHRSETPRDPRDLLVTAEIGSRPSSPLLDNPHARFQKALFNADNPLVWCEAVGAKKPASATLVKFNGKPRERMWDCTMVRLRLTQTCSVHKYMGNLGLKL